MSKFGSCVIWTGSVEMATLPPSWGRWSWKIVGRGRLKVSSANSTSSGRSGRGLVGMIGIAVSDLTKLKRMGYPGWQFRSVIVF